MPYFKTVSRSGNLTIYQGKKPGKYLPHSGAKEAAKAAKRIAAAEAKAAPL